MPSKTEEYLALAQRTANGLTRYWESWTAYLTTASRLYKYSFPDQLMIYAQRPDATACADFDIWNNRMNRYVRRGAKGIALLDESSGFPRLHYVFDVSDTGVRRNSRDPEVWQYNDDLKQPVSEMLAATYGISGERVSQQLADVAGKLVADYWDNNGGDIRAIVDGSLLMDVRLGHLIVSALHERSLHLVLHTFHGERHCDGEIVENGGEDLIHLSAPDLLALSVKRLFHGVENFLLLKGNRLPVSFSDLHFDPLIFSGHFSCPFGQRAGKRSITLARSVFESRFFCSRRGRAVCCLLSWFWLSCQLLHRFQNGVRQCFQLSALVRAHGRGEAEPLVEHRHVLKLIVDEFLHEVTGLHRP